MRQDEARHVIDEGLKRPRVTVASRVAEPERDFVRVDTGFVASWVLEVRYSNGMVALIHAAPRMVPGHPRDFRQISREVAELDNNQMQLTTPVNPQTGHGRCS
jgi:hypothetical protein